MRDYLYFLQPQLIRLNPLIASLRGNARLKSLTQQMETDLTRILRNSGEIRELFEKTVPALPPVKK